MNVSEITTERAIAYLDQRGWRVDSHAGLCADFIINALRASQKALKLMALTDARIIGKLKQDVRDGQKREREVRKSCRYRNNDGVCIQTNAVEDDQSLRKCTKQMTLGQPGGRRREND
jgi:hypothetical protein